MGKGENFALLLLLLLLIFDFIGDDVGVLFILPL